LPRSGLFRGSDDRWQAFVVRGGRARRVDLEIGLLNDVEAEVLSGLDAGDDVSNLTNFYLHIRDAQELLVLAGRVHEVVVTVSSLKRVRPAAREIAQRLERPQLAVAPWQEFAKDFYRAMKADRVGMWISLFIIILVVAVGVLNTVLMSVLERRREYGVLKALGTKPRQVFQLILIEIDLMALGSILIGAVAALGINYFFSIHGFTLSEPFTYGGVEFSHLHTEINLNSFVIPALTVGVTATLVALFPGWKAVRTDAAEAMRTN